jgi:hypothetical protein
MNYLNNLNDRIDEFPALLDGLEREFKKQVILKDLEE